MTREQLLIALFVGLSNCHAQTFCLTTVDLCCNDVASTQSLTTTYNIDEVKMTYDAGNEHNELLIVLELDGTLYDSWTVCGCGEDEVEPIASGHVVTLKVYCSGCNSICTSAESKVSIFDNATSSSCKVSCK